MRLEDEILIFKITQVKKSDQVHPGGLALKVN